ncbi:uncharacterized protein NPIL_407551 [Nephila pilipes]|uniref:Uncharacterized protein n=1 Tax=Nephila pilipes TaxID=299642 RepID=A0A8X6PD45_NEPPI|nr:uncharacterized protein NPIL_407551 [Nephila pilipes]
MDTESATDIMEVESESTTTSGIGKSESALSETSKIGMSLREKIKNVQDDEVWKVLLDEYFLYMPEISSEEKILADQLPSIIHHYYKKCERIMNNELMSDLVRRCRKVFRWNRTLSEQPSVVEVASVTELLLLEIEMSLNEMIMMGCDKIEPEETLQKDSKQDVEVKKEVSKPDTSKPEKASSDVKSKELSESSLDDPGKTKTGSYSMTLEEAFEKMFVNEVHADHIKSYLARQLRNLKVNYEFFDVKPSDRSSHPLWKNIDPSVYAKADYFYNALKCIRILIQMLRANFMLLKRISVTKEFKEQLKASKSREDSSTKEQTDVEMES